VSRKKVYYKSDVLGHREENISKSNLISGPAKEYLSTLSEEERESGEQLIAGLESRKIIEAVIEGEKIEKDWSSIMGLKSLTKKTGFTEPPKMDEAFKKLAPSFYKIFDDVVSGKKQTPSKFLGKVVSLNKELNQTITYSNSKNLTTFDRIMDSASKLMSDINAGKEFGFFDIETVSGTNAHGFQELDDIVEFAYLGYKKNQDGGFSNSTRLSSVIGITDNEKAKEIENEIESLRNIPKARWTERQRILIDTYSKYGSSNTVINSVAGSNEALWEVGSLDTIEGDIDTALKGLEKRKEIGEAQKRAAAANGGVYAYKQQFDEMIKRISSSNEMSSGHNVLKFDVPMLNRDSAKNGTQSIDTASASIYDLLASMRAIGDKYGKDFYYKNKLENIKNMKGLTANQQEAITRFLFREDGAEQHSAVKDTEQYASLFMNKMESGETFFENIFQKLQEMDASTNKIQYKYNGANKQLFYITNSELFNSYNTKNALNMVIDPVANQYRTFNGYAMNRAGTSVEKELFNQTGTMRNKTLAYFNVLKYDSKDELIKLLNPDNKTDITIPEMATKSGYVLAVTSHHDREMAEQLGIPYDASMSRTTLYFHNTYDSLLEQMSHAIPIANVENNGVLNPIEENLKNEALNLYNIIKGQTRNITPDSAVEHLNQLRKLHVERYTNEFSAEQARKLTFGKYTGIFNTFIKGKKNKDEVMAGVKKLADAVSKGIPLTQDVQLMTTLGFISNGQPKLYSETINKTANLAGYLYDQKPIFDEILSQIKGMENMQGDSTESLIDRDNAFVSSYNALMEFLSTDPNEIKNGRPTTIVGASSLDYINVNIADIVKNPEKEIGESIVGAKGATEKISLNGGSLLKQLINLNKTPNTAVTNLQGTQGFALLSQFVDNINRTDDYRNAINFTDKELELFADDAPKFETAIMGKLKDYVHKQRETNPLFGYNNETNMTQFVTEPNELIYRAFDASGKLKPEAKNVIGNAVRRVPQTIKVYNATNSGLADMVDMLTKNMFSLSKDEFAKSLQGLSEEDVKTGLYNFDLAYDAARDYATNIARGIYNSDVHIAQGKNELFLTREGRYATLNLPKFKNENGLLYAKIDNTKNALFPFLSMNKAILDNGEFDYKKIKYVSSFEKGANAGYSLTAAMHNAYRYDHDPLNAALGWLKNSKRNIREVSPSFQSVNPRIFSEQYHQDIVELVNGIKYFDDSVLSNLKRKGLIPQDFETKIKSILGHKDLYKNFGELGSTSLTEFGIYKQAILHSLANTPEIKDENVRRLLRMAADSAKDTDVAAGKIGISTMTNIGGGEFTNTGRPLISQALDSVQYRKDIIEKRLKAAGLKNQVVLGSVWTNKKSQRLMSFYDKATGYEMVNTASTKVVALDQLSFNKMLVTEKEKINNAFDKAAAKIKGNVDRTEIANNIYNKMKTLNLHEQELLISPELLDALFYKSDIQTVSSKKKMMVQFEKNLETQEAINTYNKLVPTINPDGSISYKQGIKINKGNKLFTVEGYDRPQKYGAKYNGILKYGFYNQYNERIDETDVNKLLSGHKFTDIGQIEEFLEKEHNIESKYAVLPKELQRSKLIVSGAEKGVTDFLFVGAGSLDKSVAEELKHIGLSHDINVALSDDYLDYLVSTNIIDPKSNLISKIKNERNLIGGVLQDLLDTKKTGIQGIVNQNIPGHNNANLMIQSMVGLIKDEGKLDDPEVLKHLNKAFEGIAKVGPNGVYSEESLYGKSIDVDELNAAAKEAGLFYTARGQEMYGKLFEKNGVQGSVLSVSLNHDNDWGGGTSAKTDIDKINEKLNEFKLKLEHRKAALEPNNIRNLSPEEIGILKNEVNNYEKGILALEDQKEIAHNIEKGAVYSDRLDMTLNMRQYDKDTLDTIKSKLINPEEFNQYFGHALTPEGVLSDEFKGQSFLHDWTTQIKNTMMDREETKAIAREIKHGAYAMGYNDEHPLFSLKEMEEQKFKITDIRNAGFSVAGQADETLLNKNNVYTNNMMLDLGKDFGKYQYLAISEDSPNITGNSLIKESRKEKLNSLKSAWDRYETSRTVSERSNAMSAVVKARTEYLDLERRNITGKEGKLEDALKMRLSNSHNGKVSMLAIIQGDEYGKLSTNAKLGQLSKYNSSILQTAKFGDKSLLEHYAENKVLDVQFKSESALRDMGYFDMDFMQGVLGDKKASRDELEDLMRQRLRTSGDVVLTQRFPIMKEGSGKPSLLYLDDTLQGNQTKILAASAYGMKADVDGDTLLTSMMLTKDKKSYMHYVAAMERGEDVPDNLKALVRSQSAYMIDRAVNQNVGLENEVQKDLIGNADNAILDLSSVAKNDVIGNKLYAALNGVTNITREEAIEKVAASKKYVDAARQRIIDSGEKKVSKGQFHKMVLGLIKEDNVGNQSMIDTLTQSYAVSALYDKLMTEETAKHLKGTTGEINLINKKMREAYFMTADRQAENFSMNTNIMAHVLDVVEEAAISAKKATGTVDSARIEEWRSITDKIYTGSNVNKNIAKMKSWLMDNVGDKIEGLVAKTRATSNKYRDLTDNIVNDSEKITEHYIDSFTNIVKSMAGNRGIRNSESFYKFGDKLKGISAQELMNMYVAEEDKTIKGLFAKMIFNEDEKNRLGIRMKREDYLADSTEAISKENMYLGDTREWLKDTPSTGQMVKNVLKSTGEIFEKIAKGFDGKTLAVGALGLAGAFLVSGFVGGNPSRPAETQASEDAQYYDVPSLSDQQNTPVQQNKQQGYVVNINARTNKDTQHAATAINHAVSSSYNSNIAVNMNITDDKGNINDRYVEQLISGAIS
jgi:hypothetical protein